MNSDDRQQNKRGARWPPKWKEHNYQVIKIKKPKKEEENGTTRIKIK